MNKGFLIFLIFLIIILIGISGGILYWLVFKGQTIEISPVQNLTPTPTLIQSLTPSPTPIVEEKSDLDQIKEAFAEKYNKVLNDVSAEISENNGTYAKGLVSFTGEIGGGWWLAYKDSTWVIVADGNGTVMCSFIEPYDFPMTMVPECWDENTNILKTF